MKFLIDAQLPPALAGWLTAVGHEAVALRDVGLRDATDVQICSYALEAGYIIVTKDEDYVALVGTRPDLKILWIRIGNVVNRVLLAAFDTKWPEMSKHLESGNRIVVLR